jgi:hypothetical protein
MKVLDEFMNEFDSLLKKYSIDDVVLINFDDDQMGYRQLVKLSETEEGRLLVMSFSGKGEILCPCCAEKEKDCN